MRAAGLEFGGVMEHARAGIGISVSQTAPLSYSPPKVQCVLNARQYAPKNFCQITIIERYRPRPLKNKWVMSQRVVGPSDNDSNGKLYHMAKGLFAEEDIGAEHGEGFESFRPRGPLKVDVDYLNDRMHERGLQRIRYAMKPDEAFGLIYSWDNVLADTKTLRISAWRQLAAEEGKILKEDSETQRQLFCMDAERVLRNVLCWGEIEGDLNRMKMRLAGIYYEKLSKLHAPMDGLKEWLNALRTAGVPCAVASCLDRFNLLAALQRMGLYKYFQAFVAEEDGMESLAHRFLSASLKLDRPPYKCVVFEDDPRGIAAAHNCCMKAVALIGSHPAYELAQADLAVGGFSELSVINLRRLFANKGSEFMDLQKQQGEKKLQRRMVATDTML
eukprot:c25237_g1_i1 orf=605-1768(-)